MGNGETKEMMGRKEDGVLRRKTNSALGMRVPDAEYIFDT
jgi:hypothetical protein